MSENKRGNYAKVYAFGADNTIALDGNLKSGQPITAHGEAQEGRLGADMLPRRGCGFPCGSSSLAWRRCFLRLAWRI